MTNKHTHTIATRSQATHALVYVGRRGGERSKPTIDGYAHSEASAKTRARRGSHLVVYPIVDGKVTVLKNADELLADPEALQSRADAECQIVTLYQAVGVMTTWVGDVPAGDGYTLKAWAYPSPSAAPPSMVLAVALVNVRAADQRLCVYREMHSAVTNVGERYGSDYGEGERLAAGLDEAENDFNAALDAARAAGATENALYQAASLTGQVTNIT